MRIDRRTMMTGASALAAATAAPAAPRRTDWHALAEDVKTEMAWAWDLYRTHAWGKDEIKPVSGTFSSFPLKTHHLGLSLIEALDTLWVMGLDSRFQDGVDWVKANLDFDVDGEVSVFETSIRLVGGLLSAHHASGDPVLAREGARSCRPAPPRLRDDDGDAVPLRQPEDGRSARARDEPRRHRNLSARMGNAEPADRRPALCRGGAPRRQRRCSRADRNSASSRHKSTW